MPDPPTPTPGGVPPVVFDAPTLGRAVCLGELYDQRSGKFLGVQLYPHDKVQETVTDIRHTELILSLSNTHEEKASLLDISAKLSLDILSGTIKVSGSASYVKDEKSNTHEYAYALALKMRLNEKRILFAETELGRKVLTVAQEDYIATNLATHFVSSIVYGGNFIVNLVARRSESMEEQKIDGKLQASFEKLKGAISLEGEIDANIRNDLKKMDDKFDLIIHGDVALDKVPVNPQDVLDTFPDAASLIGDNGGVPISVTLQPIPQKLYTGSLIFQLDADFVDDVLKAFSMLDDLKSRFQVLQNDVESLQGFVPELARTIRVVVAAYTKDHGRLLHELAKFLDEYQHGKKPKSGSIFIGIGDDSDITGDKVLKEATAMYEKQLDPKQKDPKISTQYPSSLAGLEIELLRFQNFVSDIQKVGASLQSVDPSKRNPFHLSSLDDVCRALRSQAQIPLFIMIPMTGDKTNPDFIALQYLALVRKYAGYFKDSVNPAYMLYAENLADTNSRLSDGKYDFSTLNKPTVVLGTVDGDGNLSWAQAPPAPDPGPTPGSGLTLKLDHKPSGKGLGDIFYALESMDGTKAYSFQIRAKSPNTAPPADSTICVVQCAGTKGPYLRFKTPLTVDLEHAYPHTVTLKSHTDPQTNTKIMITLVQDTKQNKWILYLNDKETQTVLYAGPQELLPDAAKLQLAYLTSETNWWDGEVCEIHTFTRALAQAEIGAQYAAWTK